jgi:hypothetical protein
LDPLASHTESAAAEQTRGTLRLAGRTTYRGRPIEQLPESLANQVRSTSGQRHVDPQRHGLCELATFRSRTEQMH